MHFDHLFFEFLFLFLDTVFYYFATFDHLLASIIETFILSLIVLHVRPIWLL